MPAPQTRTSYESGMALAPPAAAQPKFVRLVQLVAEPRFPVAAARLARDRAPGFISASSPVPGPAPAPIGPALRHRPRRGTAMRPRRRRSPASPAAIARRRRR